MAPTSGNDEAPAPDALVRVHRHPDGVVEILLDRPAAMNAISTDMACALRAATAQVATDPSVRVVVITSTHVRAFCVGADLKERSAFSDEDLLRQRLVTRPAYASVLDLEVPAIAAVEGFALGGGCEIALCCDLIVAGTTATFGLPEVSVGVIPGAGGTQLLARRVGWSRAADLIFTARKVDAGQAHVLGLVDRLVDAGGAREAALALAAQIARNSPVGVQNAKRAMRLGLDVPLAAGLEVEDAAWRATASSADRAEGVAAFAQKRAPRWLGR